jgi:FG-GAP repeat
LPAAAQAPVSAALGRDQAAYRINGLVARNPAQRLVARFGHSGVAVTAGSARFGIALEAFGRPNALRALAPGSPVARSDRVTYARGPVHEWWTNGPLGLEQGFDIARRPAGSGALTLSLAVSGKTRLDHGALLLPGGLRYAGLRATDARGRTLRAWLQVRDGRILVRVNDRGARYPLRIDPTVQQAELTPSDGVSAAGAGADQFGYSVATSGSTVVVGAPYHEANSQAFSGVVYVFQMPAAGWASATQTAELTDSTLGGDQELGFSVAISSDGHTIAAGAPAGSEAPPQEHGNGVGSQGTVDVFTTTGAWASTSTPNARLTVAGSPATEASGGGELGWSVAISGSTIVAGAPYDPLSTQTGQAYVFNEPGGGWSGPQNQAAVLTASLLSTANSGEDLFGWSVGISGNTIVVGAPNYAGASRQDQGAAYVFTGPWSGTQTETAELLASDPSDDNMLLGWSVGISGNTVVAGAPNRQVGSSTSQGAAYVFTAPWSGVQNQAAELTASDGISADEFGWSVAITGNTIVAGARQRNVGTKSAQGAAYVYAQPAGGWATTSAFAGELTASDGDGSDAFGSSVAVSGTTIVAGALRHDAESSTADFGAAYVFGSGSAVVPAVKLASIASRHGRITAALSCPAGGSACAKVTLKATVKEHRKGRRIIAITAHKKRKVRATTKTVVVASGSATLAAATKKTLTLTINSTGRALLAKFGKLKALVTVSSGGKTIKTVTVTVVTVKAGKPTKPKKKKAIRL